MRFVAIGSLVLINLLVGVLCDVVSTVAGMESEDANVGSIQSELEEALPTLQDGDITKTEFYEILENQETKRTMQLAKRVPCSSLYISVA